MVAINYAFREISCKIVFYGPGLSGKTTNLQYVHQKVPGKTKGELISLATDADRTLYFDFLPINLGAIQGFSTKFQLYTVPGQVYYNATRKLVLRGVDGVVFVVDSQRAKLDENIESLKNLYDNLEEYGYDAEDMPLVIQYNKRDLPDVMTIQELQSALNPHGRPHFEASAVNGTGVFDTLKMIIKLVLDKARKRSELASQAGGSATVQAQAQAQTPAPTAQAPVPTPTLASSPAPTPTPRTGTAIPAVTRPREVDLDPAVTPSGTGARDVSPHTLAAELRSGTAATELQFSTVAAELRSSTAAAAPRPDLLARPQAPAPSPSARPIPTVSGRPETTKPPTPVRKAALAPSVIPAAPSLRRSREPRKKRSFWRKLFSWI